LLPLNDFNQRLEQMASANTGKKVDFDAQYEEWCRKNDPGTIQGWAKPDLDAAGWKAVKLPGAFEQAGLPDFDGTVWFRRDFELPAGWSGQKITLSLGPIDDIDTTFVNGIKVGQMNRYDLNRVYTVPSEALKP